MKVYVAGPMRGYPHLNFPAFFEAEAKLVELGCAVINPARVDTALGIDPDSDDWETNNPEASAAACIRRDVDAVLSVDAVVVLPGWHRSNGARAERAIARWLGKPVYRLADVLAGRLIDITNDAALVPSVDSDVEKRDAA